MAGKTQHEPTRSGQILLPRNRFEYNIVRGDVPPYYFDNGAWENETGMNYRNFDISKSRIDSLGIISKRLAIISLYQNLKKLMSDLQQSFLGTLASPIH